MLLTISLIQKALGGANFTFTKGMRKLHVEYRDHLFFTEKELDFIINYDIKYRMGKEL